jgi:predicted RNase H-like nuclease (RuvC/YqgF family)
VAVAEKIIVGVDSGTTKAVALLSLYGSCETYSKKNATFYELCKFISERGVPVIVASDRHRSKLARKLAAAFSAKLFNPENDLAVREKNLLIKNHKKSTDVRSTSIANQHEKDALAAALHARNEYTGLIKKIDRRVPQRSADVVELLLKGRAVNISEAIRQLV